MSDDFYLAEMMLRLDFMKSNTGSMVILDVFMMSLSSDRLTAFWKDLEAEAFRRNIAVTRQETYDGVLLRWFPAEELKEEPNA